MKENRYDDPDFFARYDGMARSREGLAGAGEWHVLRRMLPDFGGKRVLDLGCGFGWHCRYAAGQGAAAVTGIDLSEKMLARARETNGGPRITYIRTAVEDASFGPASFDVVISSLAFHYLESFDDVCRNVFRWLAGGGRFVFSVEHPVFTAAGPQEWCRDEKGARRHWPVDRYFDRGIRRACFLGAEVAKYHRTVEDYVGGLLRGGFLLEGIAEPEPDPGMPGMDDELRRPIFLILSAIKK